ncbi:unnamed protein product [Urochloa decumbens]|uniref:Response regulatory domain-containing protein n=1 Tax=Urochloa decumbens TaxID=240449 RepID=A0ABC9D831_9POAL
MAPRTTDYPANGLRVLVVEEDKQHVNYLRAVLPQYNFHVTVYTSPIMALNFLKDHAQDVDFLLVAMHMQEISGFQFLEIATKMHRNIINPTGKAHGEQSTITELSDDAESMNEVSSSKVGSSTDVNMGLVNNSDSKAGESKEKNPNKKPRLGKTSPSPSN